MSKKLSKKIERSKDQDRNYKNRRSFVRNIDKRVLNFEITKQPWNITLIWNEILQKMEFILEKHIILVKNKTWLSVASNYIAYYLK